MGQPLSLPELQFPELPFRGDAGRGRVLPENCANPLPWRAYQGSEFVKHEQLAELLERTWELDWHESQAWEAPDPDSEDGSWSKVAAAASQDELLRTTSSSSSQSPQKTPVTGSLQLWRGVPDAWKGKLWAFASGVHPGSHDRDAAAYQQALTQAFGDRVPEHFEQCPLFCEASDMAADQDGLRQCVPFLDYLSPTGVLAAHRILWCCSQLWWTDVEFCPVIPVLVCILLVFFDSEASVYSVVRSVLIRASKDLRKRRAAPDWEAQQPFPFLPFTRAQWNDAARRAAAFAVGQMPEEAAHLKSLGVDMDAVAARALRDGLVSFLPFRGICRAYGIFLAEGFQVFVQYLIAFWLHKRGLLRHCQKLEVAQSWLLPSPGESGIIERPAAPSGDEILSVASERFESELGCSATAGMVLGIDDLSRLALAISIPQSLAKVEVCSALPACLSGSQSAGMIHVRPRLQGERSHIVWDALWPYIWQWLPPLCLVKEPFLSFQTNRDGYNLSSLLHQCEKAPPDMPMLLIVRVRAQLPGELLGQGSGAEAVIGAFFPAALCITGRGYLSLGETPVWGSVVHESYVFSVPRCPDGTHGTPKAWHWTGSNEMAFDAPATGKALLIGGDSAAFRLDEALRSGTTRTCASFGSPPLIQVAQRGGDEGAALSPTGRSYVDYDIVEVEVFELRDDSREDRGDD